ncbi:MAG: pyridine nucleotide-disulfide oxidoreductase, partial [Thermoprotei archaeon ex4572_64]
MRVLTIDILVIGAGPAGTYFTYKYLKSINDLSIVIIEKKVNPRFPIICGELIPSREILKKHIPSNIYKYLLETLNETLDSDVIVNKINFVKVFIDNYYVGLLPFKTYLIDKGKVLEKLIESAENCGCKVQFSTTVTDCLLRNETFKLRVFSKEGERIIKSKIVIGADAYPSVVDVSLNMNARLDDNELVIATSCRARSTKKYDSDVAIVLLSYDLCPGGFAWIFPRDDKVFNVGLGIRASKVSNYSDVLSRHLKFLEKFDLKPLHRPLVKTIPVSGLLNRLSLHNAYLIGDAAGSVIPTNGAGIN